MLIRFELITGILLMDKIHYIKHSACNVDIYD